MTPTPPQLQDAHLPAPGPDLVVAGRGEEWRVRRLSPRLAGVAGVTAEDAAGRPLTALLSQSVPTLAELAREASERDAPLQGVRVRLAGPRGRLTLEAEIRPAGLTEDYRGREVLFFFREPPREEEGETGLDGLVGAGAGMREVFRKIELYAPAAAAVVVTGETGTGKELVARALHERSPRRQGPYVAVNCTAIADELLESELFGHEKGAFTGALRTHRGRFERADGGTLFLDEIGDMPLRTQAKLLRVLEDGRVERVGAEAARQVDVRVVGATNVPLERAVGQGRFRADLYHRLSVLRIHLPPLRERSEDIPLLVAHFLGLFNARYGRRVRRLTPEALALLQSYLWPGNVRELRNVLERVYVENAAEVIGARAFAEWVRERGDFSAGGWNLQEAAARPHPSLAPPYPLASERPLLAPPETPHRSTRPAELDAEEIRAAFAAAGGNLSAAARLLGVHRATLYRYLEKLGLGRKELEEGAAAEEGAKKA